jgi:hypothetical protein
MIITKKVQVFHERREIFMAFDRQTANDLTLLRRKRQPLMQRKFDPRGVELHVRVSGGRFSSGTD